MRKNYADHYSELLYSLLPELYRKKDYDTQELKRFLSIIGEEAGALRENMDELWYDFFIETCHDWVVPYIGDLLGANLVFNDASRNRVIVKKTIPWKRSKGTMKGLEDVARGITGWGVNTVEFFELLNWSQNMNHIKLDKPCTPDIKNIYTLDKLNSSDDTIPHTADMRNPTRQQGWYNIKNLGYFFFTKQVYQLEHTTPKSISSAKYGFSPIGRDVSLFDLKTKDVIRALEFRGDVYGYFGTENGMSIYCNGVLVAAPGLPPPAPVRPDKDEKGCTVGKLNDVCGMRILDWQGKGGFKIEALDVNWDGEKYSESKVWGSLTTSNLQYTTGSAESPDGSFMLRISRETNARGALFPEAILVLRGEGEIIAKDTRESIYSNALYIYMPEVFLSGGDELCLFADHAGATYYTFESSVKTGAPTEQSESSKPIVPPEKAFDIKNIARESSGQVYPPRSLTNSMKPLIPDSINREAGLIVCDNTRLQERHFTIQCCSIDFGSGQSAPSRKELGKLRINYIDIDIEYIPGQEPDGKGFALWIKHEDGDMRFPQCEIILKDSRGSGVLIYLPEINFKSDGDYIYLYPADDGSTYYTNYTAEHTGEPLLKPDRGGAFNISLLARKSAGQVLPIPDTFPLQQRKVGYRDLRCWNHPEFRKPDAGSVAIDPALGRFCFPDEEVPDGVITVKYNDAFSYDVGAWTTDRRAGLREPDVKIMGSDKSDARMLLDEIVKAPDKGVVQIEDSLTYDTEEAERSISINRSLTIQAANFKRPTITGNILVNGNIEELRLDGLFFTTGNQDALIKLTAPVNKLVISNCMFDPGKVFLEVPDEFHVSSIEISNSITGKISCKSADSIQITDSIVHSNDDTAISGKSNKDNSCAVLRIERSTIIGGCLVRELFSSNSIHMGIIKVINTQHGCIRYSRYQEKGSILPRVFNSTQDVPLFNSRSSWRFDYCELSQNCSEEIRAGSDKGSEMGAFSAAQNTIKEKNVRIKLKEYMPFGQRPVIIYEV